MNKADQAPLYKALTMWKDRNPLSFHVPGHKNGTVFSTYRSADNLFKEILNIDATELSGLDDLHHADGPIKKAEQLTADLYGSVESRFLVGGSSAGNLAMIMALCSEGDIVLVQKNCHKSVLNGLRLSKAHPIFLTPSIDEESQVSTGVSVDLIHRAITRYKNIKAIVLTNPNYYGMTNDLKPIISYAHQKGIPVLVDEAHGAHFVKESFFPESALKQGADVVVQSAHKTLPAMTMGSYLHIGDAKYRNAINDYLQVFQSSSPSYPIMASLDLARHYISSLPDKQLGQILEEILQFKHRLNEIPGINVIGDVSHAYKQIDPIKITVQLSGTSGYDLAKKLENEGIFVELSDPLNILLICPIAFNGEAYERTLQAFKRIAVHRDEATFRISMNQLNHEEITFPAYSFAKLETMNTNTVSIRNAVGLIAAKAIIPYPPGIPIVLPGERITLGKTQLVETVLNGGGHIQGMNGEMIEIAIEEE
ncbi:aminotransferase class I/II-fold pyridoxal phosphate-dependent enzyme [Guptibacillus hwajinpoensis]|uniref:aminotransferase class I/II-fold pyridoxal phosphate-dependent enzyme n=1 Tax=Guptibacillus hwajinpoensis TaxID=208199 RepID=UPI001CFEFE8A|nr:aminotransferase class I/II-fold pyridoxal phosphate-dependent enzyme [Pseudalkalibacillus hwajinpoensis]WLR58018.1 aminotransferase class I/II-fold pyridoxal phosphate-dependent enzyme [Pseudalkalibacillus hwajinpoensis]